MKRTFIKKGIFTCIAAILGVASSFGQTVNTGAVTPNVVCAGGSLNVAFTTTAAVTGSPTFSVELSDATGVFPATPNVIGSGTTSPLSASIPVSTPAGASYKVRVSAPAPIVTGTASGVIAVSAIPAAPVVSSPVSYSQNQQAQPLSATALSGNTLNWYGQSQTGGTVSATPTIPVTSGVGTFTYYVSQVNAAGCESSRAAISVVVSACATPAPPVVTNPVNYTQNQVAVPLAATALSGNTLNWYGMNASGGTAATTAPTPITTAVGTFIYYVSQVNSAGCESPRAAISVVVAACTAPSAPVVTSPVNYTQNQVAAPLVATALSGNTLNWYGTNATGGTAATAAPAPSTASVGTFTYYVSQVNAAGCESARATITVVVAACTVPAPPTVTNPVNYTQNETPVALTATALTGNTLNWYGQNASGGTPSATPTIPSTSAIGTNIYYVSQITSGGCESPRAAISVVVSACLTPAPTVTTPVSYTVGATAVPLSATGTALKWYTAATGGTALTVTPTPLTTTAGTTSYYVSQTLNACEGPRAKIDVVVSTAACATVAPTVANVTYCLSETPVVLTATGTALKWYDGATGGTALGAAPTPSTTTAGTVSYYVSQTLNGCEGPRAKIDVIVNPQTPAPTVVSPISYNVGATASPLTATGTALKWYTAATGGTALAIPPTPLTTTAGTTSYYVSQTLNGCEGPRAKIDIVVSTAACTTAAPTVTSPVNYTVGATNAVPLTATGTALKWYTSATGGTGVTTAPTPSTATAGTTSYYVSQTLNGCEGPRAEIVVSVAVCTTPAPTVVSPLSYATGVTTAVPLTATGTALKWYTTATGGTGVTTAPTPSTATAGTTSYYVSQTLNGCEGPRAKIDVVVTTVACTTVAPTVVNITYCLTETASVLTATGVALKWYTAATGGTGVTTAPTPSTATAGTTSYYVSQTLNGCEGPRAKIDVIVNPQTPAPTVANVTYCLSETASVLTATGVALKWYNAATGGTALTAAPTPATTTAGTVSYYVSQTLNGCEGSRAKIDVVVNPQTASPTIGAPVVYCFNETASPLSATGTALKWYSAATGGTALAAAPTPLTTTAGITSYYVSQTINTCEGTRAKVDVTVKPQVPAPAVAAAAIEYCQSVKASPLTATPAAGAILNWYGTNATGGTATATAPTPSTEGEGTTSYYVNQKDVDGCLSSRAKIDVKINVTPKPTLATSFVEYCQGATASPLSATGNALKWYLTLTDTNPRTSALTPFTEKVEDYSFYVTQTGTNTCESPKAEIKVHIKPRPSATISGNNSVAPGQSTSITINFTGDGPWQYTLSNGQTGTANNATTQVTVTPQITTNYVVTRVSNACGEGISNGVAVVTVLIPTITTGSPSVSQLCAGRSFTVPFQKSGDFPTGNAFTAQISTVNEVTRFVSIPSTDNGTILTATIPDTVKAGSYFIRVVSAGQGNVLPGSVSSVKMTINPLPVATITGPANLFMGQSATLSIAITGDAPWTFNLNDGVKDTLISSSISPIAIRITPKTTSVYQITSISNGCGVGRGAGTFRVQVDPVLGTEPPVAAADWLKVYPTMIENKCTVEITSVISAREALFEIFDLNGRSLSKKSIRQKITEVDFTSRPSGMYLLKVQNGDRTSVQRIFKP